MQNSVFSPFYLVWGGALIIKEVFIFCSGCEMGFVFYHKCCLQNWTGRWKLRSFGCWCLQLCFHQWFQWHGIKSTQLTLIQSLGKPPRLSQEHKPHPLYFPTMKAGNVQTQRGSDLPLGSAGWRAPQKRKCFLFHHSLENVFLSTASIWSLEHSHGQQPWFGSGFWGSKVFLSFVTTSWSSFPF